MFKILKKLFIYLLLLPRTFTFPVNGNDDYNPTTPRVDEAAVEQKLLDYAKYLDKIPNVEERAEFKGELKTLVRQALGERLLLKVQGRLEYEKQTLTNALWLERVRSAIENFEDDVGKNADVLFPTYKEEKDMMIRRRIFRERKWKWIFENKSDEYRVKTLKTKIENSPEVASTNEFSELIARAFSELSKYIHQELLKPGSGNFDVKFATTDPKVNRAVELFMDLFEIRDIIAVPK